MTFLWPFKSRFCWSMPISLGEGNTGTLRLSFVTDCLCWTSISLTRFAAARQKQNGMNGETSGCHSAVPADEFRKRSTRFERTRRCMIGTVVWMGAGIDVQHYHQLASRAVPTNKLQRIDVYYDNGWCLRTTLYTYGAQKMHNFFTTIGIISCLGPKSVYLCLSGLSVSLWMERLGWTQHNSSFRRSWQCTGP